MEQSSPARLYAGLVGVTLLIAGIIGFFYSASFGSPGDVDAVFGILDVNGWHNVVHILTGALGLLAFGASVYAARQYALALGVVYLIVAIWGFIVGDGDQILSIIPVNTEDNVLHLLLGLAGLAAGLATAEAGRPAPAGPATT
jgi:Domain of unknown function (DUF4383)